ncbi:MAG: glycosyltransferase family 2 protein [Gammaproteobacteria bacterium]
MSGISVVIPVYNRATYIQRALKSVLSQTLSVDEIIVVNDGSTDNTAAILAAGHADIRLITQQNQGVSTARNTGIRAAKNEWIAFLDSDDEWLPEKIQKQTEALAENPEYFIAHTNEIWMQNGSPLKQMKKHRKYGGYIFQHCLPLCIISPSSVIIHRSIFERLGLFDETLPVCEDYDMWLRICARYPVLFHDEELIIKHGGHDDQLSRKYWGMDRFRIQAIKMVLSDPLLSGEDRAAALRVMSEKIHILLNGARKHNNRALIASLEALRHEYRPV